MTSNPMPTETSVQHTPGPWEVEPNAWGGTPHVRSSGRRILRLLAENEIGQDEILANARLIALAPTAPHECDPSCPGEQNRRKLDLLQDREDAAYITLDKLIQTFQMRDDLLAALKIAYGVLDTYFLDDSPSKQLVREAISKAEGVRDDE